MSTIISRRTVLGGMAATAGGVIGTAIPLSEAAPVETVPPTREELERYYSFLWAEHCALAEELGVDTFDSFTAHRRGGMQTYRQTCNGTKPSERAKAVLASAGFAAEAWAMSDVQALQSLIDAHGVAMRRYDSLPGGNVPDDVAAELMRAGEALCEHRPLTIEGVHLKAAYMVTCDVFVGGDIGDPEFTHLQLVRGFLPQDSSPEIPDN